MRQRIEELADDLIQEHEGTMEQLLEAVEDIDRLDLLVLKLNLFAEYLIETTLDAALANYESSGDGHAFDTFNRKLRLFEVAIETNDLAFDEMKETVVRNIDLLRKSRNDVAHEIDWEKNQEAVENRIRAMDDPYGFDLADSFDDPVQEELFNTMMGTFTLLLGIQAGFKTDTES